MAFKNCDTLWPPLKKRGCLFHINSQSPHLATNQYYRVQSKPSILVFNEFPTPCRATNQYYRVQSKPSILVFNELPTPCRLSHFRYALSVARKLGCFVFLAAEDVTSGKPSLMLMLLVVSVCVPVCVSLAKKISTGSGSKFCVAEGLRP